MKTRDEIKRDGNALFKEISQVIDTIGDTGSAHLAMYAVLDARPDLKQRFDALTKEYKELCDYEQKAVG